MNKRTHWILARFLMVLLLALVPSIVLAAPLAQDDGLRAKADALYDEGIELYDQESYQDAFNRFQEALKIYQELGLREDEGLTLNMLGLTCNYLNLYEEALDYYQPSLEISQEMGDKEGEGRTLNNIGLVYYNMRQYSQALDKFQQSLAIAREIGDRTGEGAMLSGIAAVYYTRQLYSQALDYYQQALEIAQEAGDQQREVIRLADIATVYSKLGQNPQAIDTYEQLLPIQQELGDQSGQGSSLYVIGYLYNQIGKYEQALDYLQQSLAVQQEIGNRGREAVVLNGLGQVYVNLGQYPQALVYHQKALAILEEIGDLAGAGRAINNIALIYIYQGLFEEGLDYSKQALALAQENGDQEVESAILENIGIAYEYLEQYELASSNYQKALALVEATGNKDGQAATLTNLGSLNAKLGKYELALDYHQKALSILQEIGDRAREGLVLASIGSVHKELGNIDEAIRQYQQAVQVLESIQGEIKVEELKASFAGEQESTYDNLTELLWEKDRFEEALNYAERARSRAFLDQLAGGAIDFRAGVNVDSLERELSLQNQIAALRAHLITLRSYPTDELDTDAIAAVEAELQGLEVDYSQLLTEIKLQSPEVAGLISVDVASLAEIQRLLDADTTLIEYFFTNDRLLIFIITQAGFETVTVDVSQDELAETITAFRDFVSLEDPHPATLKQLYTWLIAPLKDKLKTPVVGVIPHGPLHYLPFAALTNGEQYFGEEYSLFTLPSASAIRFIQEKRDPSTNKILALGNPTTTEAGLASLDFAQQEVQTITKLFDTQPLVGDSATESALRSQASTASIVHLAAHGQYNAFNPLFSVIYLAAGNQEDGRLEVNEIYGLDLRKSTDLVVLSACETQVGAVSGGDEVVGMTRAFLYAGTPSVIASLWKVDDQATTLLMERFYIHLRDGMGKAQALQTAQNDVRAEFPHPYYWAAFVLTGDAGKHVQPTSIESAFIDNLVSWAAGTGGLFLIGLSCLGLVVFLVGGIVWWKRKKRV